MASAHSVETVFRPFIFTSVGKKYLMGLTGLVWAGFIFGHMAGNMLMFISADAYNAYGHAITSGMAIYLIEGVLLLSLIVHVVCATLLTLENRRARGVRYAVTSSGPKAGSWASRTMAIQGSVILAFVILHLATFKFGAYYTVMVHGEEIRDLHRLMVEVFSNPAYVAWYVVALFFLFFHLSHGIGSLFQSFGIKNERMEKSIKVISWAYAIVVAGGFLTQPLYILIFAQ